MDAENTLFLDIWEVVKGYCPARKRDELAHRLLHILEDHGFESERFTNLLGEDFNLDNAVNEWIEEHEDDIEDNYEEEYYLEDED